MTEAGISTEPAQSTSVTTGRALANVLRSFAEISAAALNFFRPSRAGSAEWQVESGALESEGATPRAADVDVDSGPEIKAAGHFAPDPQEIERRRTIKASSVVVPSRFA